MTYTLADAESLAKTLASHNCTDTDIIQSQTEIWLSTFNEVKEEFDDIKEIILEMLGPYHYGFSRQQFKENGLIDLIFNTPLDEMPLYISSEFEWQAVISLWRLSIDK